MLHKASWVDTFKEKNIRRGKNKNVENVISNLSQVRDIYKIKGVKNSKKDVESEKMKKSM